VLRIFQVCFATGVIFSVLSFLIGRVSDFTHFGADADLDIDAGIDTDMDSDLDTGSSISLSGDTETAELPVSPLKPIIITTFITVFGGVGMICTQDNVPKAMSLITAAASGTAAAFLLHRFVVIPLYRAQNTSAVSQKRLKGALAKVTLPIRDGLFGKINYTVGGNTYSAPARSIDGGDIERGVPVVIINIEKNTFYVKEIKGGF